MLSVICKTPVGKDVLPEMAFIAYCIGKFTFGNAVFKGIILAEYIGIDRTMGIGAAAFIPGMTVGARYNACCIVRRYKAWNITASANFLDRMKGRVA